jgi:large subunit ribosomal protein L22
MEMEFRAEHRFVRVSPQKARLVCDLIKGRRVEDALNALTFSTKRISPDVEKVLRSAVQNASYMNDEKGLDIDIDNLYVKHAIANEGPRMKRIRPAPMGRAFRYQRRLAHIAITLAERKTQDQEREKIATTVTAETAATPAKGRTAGKKTAGKKTAKKSAAKKR